MISRIAFLAAACWSFSPSTGFVAPPLSIRELGEDAGTTTFPSTHRRSYLPAKTNGEINGDNSIQKSQQPQQVDVVLFGVGDLRVDDHVGLYRALGLDGKKKKVQREDNNGDHSNGANRLVLPLMVLSKNMLARIPGVVPHTADTANVLSAALADLNQNLLDTLQSPLLVKWIDDGSEDDNGSKPRQLLERAILDTVQTHSTLSNLVDTKIRVHVCDLGPADNEMGYAPYSYFLAEEEGSKMEIVPWTSDLRSEPWKDLAPLPDKYPDYAAKYSQAPEKPVQVTESTDFSASAVLQVNNVATSPSIPTGPELTEILTEYLNLDPARVKAERGTGLYATHWGGLPATSVGSKQVLELLNCFTSGDCQEDDIAWEQHPKFIGRSCRRTGTSLEHAAMQWQLRGDGKSPAGNPLNWLAGESMVRYLAAPLLFGTISPRRIWHASTVQKPFFTSPLKQLVEGREWHRLFAARNILSDPMYRGEGSTVYKYWRYHGFLCRYAVTDMASSSATSAETKDKKEGILLVHGFGASGSQWNKAMQELSLADKSRLFCQGIAPDLIGFGHSEKPAISYTGYTWDGMVLDFVKEIACHKLGWNSFVVGGNSIGGFTALSMAACDTATVGTATSTGAPGTNLCTGLVLMNSAGPVLSEEAVNEEAERLQGLPRSSVAQITVSDALPPCSPPPRPLGRIFGNVLLAYLRPQVQSICKNLYPTNPAAVDDALCEAIRRDSCDPGALNVMMSGAKLPPPRTANELLKAKFGGASEDAVGSLPESVFDGPVLIAQGVLDPLNDCEGRMKLFGALRDGITMDPIQAGHCPHDELPDAIAASIVNWAIKTQAVRQARLSRVVTPSAMRKVIS